MEDRNFDEMLIGALADAVAYEKGELNGVRTDQVEITARKAAVRPPPRYDASKIRSVRERLRVSQPAFAGMLNVSNSTVRAWEQGVREPDGPTLRLLEVAEMNPAVLWDNFRGHQGK
jgi:putative transcriptional regulator